MSEYIAIQKGHTEKMYFWIGFFLLFIGIIVAAVATDKKLLQQIEQIKDQQDNKEQTIGNIANKSNSTSEKITNQIAPITECLYDQVDIANDLIIKGWNIKEIDNNIFAEIVFEKLNNNLDAAKINLKQFNSFNDLLLKEDKEIQEIIVQDIKEKKKEFMECIPVNNDTRKIEINIFKLLMKNGETIEKKNSIFIKPSFKTISDSKEKTALKEICHKAIGYPVCTENYWQCCCGELNSLNNTCCMSCRKPKKTIISLITKAKVIVKMDEIDKRKEKAAIESKNAALESKKAALESRKEAILLAEKREEKRKEKQKKDRKIMLLIGIIISIVISIVIIVTSIVSVVKYYNQFEIIEYENSIAIVGLKENHYNNIVIPKKLKGKEVTSIEQDAFHEYYGDDGISKVKIPNTVTSIGDGAFYNCDSLTSIIIPDSVTSIGSGAFSGCSGLTGIFLPFVGASRTATGSDALLGYIFGTSSYAGGTSTEQFYASGLSNTYYIPTNLVNVIITDATSIQYGAFSNCSILTSIVMPDSITSIEDAAFYSCTSLTSVTIPESVASIGSYVFNNCSSLTSVTIADSVTCIGNRAFISCDKLTSIIINTNVPPNLSYSAVFDSLPSNYKIYVPAGSVNAYKLATYWSEYADHIYAIGD